MYENKDIYIAIPFPAAACSALVLMQAFPVCDHGSLKQSLALEITMDVLEIVKPIGLEPPMTAES